MLGTEISKVILLTFSIETPKPTMLITQMLVKFRKHGSSDRPAVRKSARSELFFPCAGGYVLRMGVVLTEVA